MYNSLQVDGNTNLGELSAMKSFIGNLDVSNNLNVTGNAAFGRNGITSNGDTRLNGNTYITNDRDSYSTISGALQVTGGMSTTGNVHVGGNLNVNGNTNFAQIVNITNKEDATNYNSGCLRLDGGISVKKDAFVLGNVDINSNLTVRSVVDTKDISSGSVIISGGCAIVKNVTVGGNAMINGNSLINQSGFVGLNNIVPIVPLSTPFTSSSIGVSGEFISSTTNSGTYHISAGTVLTDSFYEIFNSTPSTKNWVGSGYNTSGSYISTNKTTINDIPILGDFVQINLPNPLVLTSYILNPIQPSPKSWILCGSNDGNSFYNLDQRTNSSFFDSTTFHREMSVCTLSYIYYRLVVTSSTSSTTTLNKFFFNGYVQSVLNNNSVTSFVSVGSSNVFGNFNVGGITKISNATDSTSQSNGSLVLTGGLGMKGNAFMNDANVGGNLIVKSNGIINGNAFVNGSLNVRGQFLLGNIILNNEIETTRLGVGALILSNGGASIAGNIFTGGNIQMTSSSSNLNVSGNTIVNGTIFGNIASSNVVINTGGSLTISQGAYLNLIGSFSVPNNTLTSNVESNDIRTGTLVVNGGAGISGNIFVGGNVNVRGNILMNESIVLKNSIVFGNILSNNTLDSSAIGTGALQVSGGSSIVGNIFIGGNAILSRQMVINSNINSGKLGDGSLIVVGGSSITGNSHVGGNSFIYGSLSDPLSINFPETSYPSTGLFMTVPDAVPDALNQTSSSIVTNQIYVKSYQNGTYLTTTGANAFSEGSVTYFGYYALILTYDLPWISSHSYSSSSGFPITKSIATSYNLPGNSSVNIIFGDWLQYSMPYQMILESYSIIFKSSTSSKTLQSIPTSWFVLGSNDGNSWFFINEINNFYRSTNLNTISTTPVVFQVSDSKSYAYYRFVITKSIELSQTQNGANIPGIYNVSLLGIPSISPMPLVTANVSVNSKNQLSIGNNNNNALNSLVGLNSFSGNSALTVFGDTTTYASLNVFKDINIIGNVNNPTRITNVNTDLYVYGNIYCQNNAETFSERVYGNLIYGVRLDCDNMTSNGNITSGRVYTQKLSVLTDISTNKIFTQDIAVVADITAKTIYVKSVNANAIVNCRDIVVSESITGKNMVMTGLIETFNDMKIHGNLTGLEMTVNNILASGLVKTANCIAERIVATTDISTNKIYVNDIYVKKVLHKTLQS
jgi:hypothetical protein